MKNHNVWLILTCLMVVTLLLASCVAKVTDEEEVMPQVQEEVAEQEEEEVEGVADEKEVVEEEGTDTPEPESISTEPPFGIETADGYEIEHILCPKLLGPGDVEIGPNGDIFVTEWDGSG